MFLVRVSCTSGSRPHSSGIRSWHRLEHCSIPIQKVACTRLRNAAHKYIVHKSKFLLSLQCIAQHWTEYKITLMDLFSAPEIFIPGAYGTKNRCWKPAPENGVDLWRRFLECLSWVLGQFRFAVVRGFLQFLCYSCPTINDVKAIIFCIQVCMTIFIHREWYLKKGKYNKLN